ncbi:MAG: hypothetical protein NZ553_17240 [Caldilinea sp.]|nr:hypothetical protein [Caldilinea sp.]MDW8442227.1 hypothetical protein [Caldilineaceae bacterium]
MKTNFSAPATMCMGSSPTDTASGRKAAQMLETFLRCQGLQMCRIAGMFYADEIVCMKIIGAAGPPTVALSATFA